MVCGHEATSFQGCGAVRPKGFDLARLRGYEAIHAYPQAPWRKTYPMWWRPTHHTIPCHLAVALLP
jgi:hypothetical protein